MENETLDTEFIILENIYDSLEQEISPRQRDLAQIAGTSLGMTNSILKRLVKKGWITIKKLNNRNIQYAITLEGLNEIIHRSYRYFKRTIKNVAFYKDRIDEAIVRAKKKNLTAVLLIGASDLEFIVEHSCQYFGLSFFKAADMSTLKSLTDKTLVVYSETIPSGKVSQDALSKQHILCLFQLMMKNPEMNPAELSPVIMKA
ncbi:MAG: MarR family transcriptional regulator [Treponema sp.]|jgi:DNA-binding MarR family transcriptional regulator|nr:MarR family transcriptional regulator [Treponema sp.]